MLGIMLSWTTYGTWLRGDARGWVDKGIVYPPDPTVEAGDRKRLRHSPFRFPRAVRLRAGSFAGEAVHRLGGRVHALFVGSWHVHLVTGYLHVPIPQIIKALKGEIRVGMGYRRPIWGGGYDKRFCYDERSLSSRIEYVRSHNVEDALPPDPWSFIVPPHLPPRP